jgi:hypothetical protein
VRLGEQAARASSPALSNVSIKSNYNTNETKEEMQGQSSQARGGTTATTTSPTRQPPSSVSTTRPSATMNAQAHLRRSNSSSSSSDGKVLSHTSVIGSAGESSQFEVGNAWQGSLHTCYTWSEDGCWLSVSWTDECGVFLQTKAIRILHVSRVSVQLGEQQAAAQERGWREPSGRGVCWDANDDDNEEDEDGWEEEELETEEGLGDDGEQDNDCADAAMGDAASGGGGVRSSKHAGDDKSNNNPQVIVSPADNGQRPAANNTSGGGHVHFDAGPNGGGGGGGGGHGHRSPPRHHTPVEGLHVYTGLPHANRAACSSPNVTGPDAIGAMGSTTRRLQWIESASDSQRVAKDSPCAGPRSHAPVGSRGDHLAAASHQRQGQGQPQRVPPSCFPTAHSSSVSSGAPNIAALLTREELLDAYQKVWTETLAAIERYAELGHELPRTVFISCLGSMSNTEGAIWRKVVNDDRLLQHQCRSLLRQTKAVNLDSPFNELKVLVGALHVGVVRAPETSTAADESVPEGGGGDDTQPDVGRRCWPKVRAVAPGALASGLLLCPKRDAAGGLEHDHITDTNISDMTWFAARNQTNDSNNGAPQHARSGAVSDVVQATTYVHVSLSVFQC